MRIAYQIKFYGDESTEKRDKEQKSRNPRKKTAAMELRVFAVIIRCIVLNARR